MSDNLQQFLGPYIASNVVALILLALAFRRPRWVRVASIAIFAWAALVNSRIALFHPLEYQGFGDLAVLSLYRDFIHGWFRQHTTLLLLPIAIGQAVIALLLATESRNIRRLGVVGGTVFLLAICPLGVGSTV